MLQYWSHHNDYYRATLEFCIKTTNKAFFKNILNIFLILIITYKWETIKLSPQEHDKTILPHTG